MAQSSPVDQGLQDLVLDIAGLQGWWNTVNSAAYMEAAEQLITLGMSRREVPPFLAKLFAAARDELAGPSQS